MTAPTDVSGKEVNVFGIAANDVGDRRSSPLALVHQSTVQAENGVIHIDTIDAQELDGMKGGDRLGVMRFLLQDVAEVNVKKGGPAILEIRTNSDAQRALAELLIAEFYPIFSEIKELIHKKKHRGEPLRDAVKAIRQKHGLMNPVARNNKIPLNGIPEDKLTPNQLAYKRALRESDCVFGYGPAGTGKTALPLEVAIELYNQGIVTSIIFVKPIVISKGEDSAIGAFGGDLDDKFDPYFENIIELLKKRIGADHLAALREKGVIKLKPFSMMRGQNFDGAFVVLDEAQNCTPAQIRTVMTRLADSHDGNFKPRIAITGDLEQKDTPDSVPNGLLHALVHYTPTRITGSTQIGFTAADIKRSVIAAQVHEAGKKPDPSHPLYEQFCREFGIQTGAALPSALRIDGARPIDSKIG